MSIASEITRLQTAKANLKTAINAKGQSITNEKLDAYAGFDDLGYATESGIKDDEIDIVSIFRTTT